MVGPAYIPFMEEPAMLRSWCAPSRAFLVRRSFCLAACAAILLPASLALAIEPRLLWPTLAESEPAIALAQCVDGNCPLYGYSEPTPAVVVEGGSDHGYVIDHPGCCDAMPSCAPYDMPSCCDVITGGCGSACSGCDSCCCCPLWTVRGEALFWTRTGGGGVPLVATPVAVSSSDFSHDWEIGPRVTVIRHGICGSCWDLEAAYFSIDNWSDTIFVADIDALLTTPPIVFGVATPGTITYDSSLHSAELNARRAWSDWITWLVGVRWVELSEELNTVAGTVSHIAATRNHLYGGQLGLDAVVWDQGGPWSFNAVGKAGIYGVDADAVTVTAGAGALPLVAASGGDVAFVGELGFNARYRFTDRLTAIAGYNLLWVSGVALAPEQLATTNIATGVATVDVDGTLFAHGANVGLEYVW
jgi:hypothetical protein